MMYWTTYEAWRHRYEWMKEHKSAVDNQVRYYAGMDSIELYWTDVDGQQIACSVAKNSLSSEEYYDFEKNLLEKALPLVDDPTMTVSVIEEDIEPEELPEAPEGDIDDITPSD